MIKMNATTLYLLLITLILSSCGGQHYTQSINTPIFVEESPPQIEDLVNIPHPIIITPSTPIPVDNPTTAIQLTSPPIIESGSPIIVDTTVPQIVEPPITPVQSVSKIIHYQQVKFFLDPMLVGELTSDQLVERLKLYVKDVNDIFIKTTSRQFIFNGIEDVTLTTNDPFSNTSMITPEYVDFDVWIRVKMTDRPLLGTYSGTMSYDISGARGVNNMFWDQIHDASSIDPTSQQAKQYWRQIVTIAHELCHSYGCGYGEFYKLSVVKDITNIQPVQNISKDDHNDAFWNQHSDWYADPMVQPLWDYTIFGIITDLNVARKLTRFCDINSAIIDNRDIFDYSLLYSDMRNIKIEVKDLQTNEPIFQPSVYVWNVVVVGDYTATPLVVNQDENHTGLFTFDWYQSNSMGVGNLAVLIKAYSPNYESKAMWVTLFDSQKNKLIDKQNQWNITILLKPI
jgi:hypothetical protein